MNPRISSGLAAVTLHQEPKPLLVGERLNATGSAAAKKLLMTNDIDGMVSLAREQSETYGAHCLDICLPSNELAAENEKRVVLEIVKRLSLEVKAPLMIDSTESDVILEAVRQIPGRPIINSINIDKSDTRLEDLTPIIRQYGLPFVAMCMDHKEMAQTANRKIDLAHEIYKIGTARGFKPDQFIFDVCTLTIVTGDPSHRHLGVETLEGVELVKKAYPNSFTVLGVSNISFGLKNGRQRELLNSVFLHHAVKAGLDLAIVNIKGLLAYDTIPKEEKHLAEAVVLDKHKDALIDYIEYFEKKSTTTDATQKDQQKTTTTTEITDPLRALYARIIERQPDGIENAVDVAIAHVLKKSDKNDNQKRHDAALEVLNQSLLPAMKEVGDRFGAGQLILPFVLRSAECMKSAVGRLETYLLKADAARSKGTIVLGTVYGDVHDIGKNLVKTILQNNGYRVVDLGKQVPISAFTKAIRTENADAIGLSALLVSTSKQMALFTDHARAEHLDIPILCGGAAINSTYINRIAISGDKGQYKPGLFYCRDMFAGLRVFDSLTTSKESKAELLAKRTKDLEIWERRDAQIQANAKHKQVEKQKLELQPISPDTYVKYNILHIQDIALEQIWQHLDLNSLFKTSWGVSGRASSKEHINEHRELLEEWKNRVVQEEWFEPHIIYGLFSCKSNGHESVIIQSQQQQVNKTYQFDFPRSEKNGLCLADYFSSTTNDTVALQAVTVGSRVTNVLQKLEDAGKYTDMYYLHGLATQAAESLADICNKQITEMLNVPKTLRYSWGYPACPDVSQHKMVWELLGLGNNRKSTIMSLTESGQIVPEHSTAAFVVHNQSARYFS